MQEFNEKTYTCGQEVFEKEASEETLAARSLAPPSGDLKDYIPKPTDKLKQVCLNFHFFQKDDGTNNYTHTDRPRINQMVGWLNDIFSKVASSSENVQYSPIVDMKDTRIRFNLHKVEFYRDSSLESSTNIVALQKAAVARNPGVLGQLNVYFTNGTHGSAVGFATKPSASNMQFNSYVVMVDVKRIQQGGSGYDWGYTHWLAHELGHTLDLCHTYRGGGCSANCDTSSPDYLFDVFGIPSTCPFPQGHSNNLMGGGSQRWISALQAAKMHRALTEKSVKRYLSRKNDIVVWRPSNGGWYVKGVWGPIAEWGLPSDIPTPADYNGDGVTEVAIWRPSNGGWYIHNVSGPVALWGQGGDIPLPGDYTGVGKAQFAFWRPSNGTWYIKGGSNIQWGTGGDIPVQADYNGDGKLDVAVWRPSNGTWYIKGQQKVQWGQAGDIPVPADYNGDGKAEIAVWRPSNGVWYIKGGSNIQWGQAGDIPIPGDFLGCPGHDQLVVYRPSDAKWYIRGYNHPAWGIGGDMPIRGSFS